MTNFTRSMRTPGGRLAISALAIAVVVFVAIGVAVELVFLPKASTSGSAATTTATSGQTGSIYCLTPSSSCVTPTSTVQTAVNNWVAAFNSRNVAALGNFYSQDAAVVWAGSSASGLAGTYNGQGNIRILYGSTIGKTTSLNASISDLVAKELSPDSYNVTLTLYQKGNSTVVGALAITVDANQLWDYVSGQWQIVKENWNYVAFSEQFPVSATTFPQWTAMKEGQNPNLVSEKSFEWHAGPYVAASVYAFLFGILAFGVVKLRRRPHSQ